MTQTVQANELTLQDVEDRFSLSQVDGMPFFSEYQVDVSDGSNLDEYNRRQLDQARTDFLLLAKAPIQEEIVKLVVVSPVLSAAGFYRPPYHLVAEKQVGLAFQEEDEILRGRLDILVLNQSLWVTVLESKGKRFNVLEAVPQALFYMMGSSASQNTVFGLATNGSEFLFLKLQKGNSSQYAFSRLFSLLNPGNDLYAVVSGLKQIGEIVTRSAIAA